MTTVILGPGHGEAVVKVPYLLIQLKERFAVFGVDGQRLDARIVAQQGVYRMVLQIEAV